jgi:hypothetical protein
VGIVLVLATAGVFYAVGRSEDRERAREARPPAKPGPRRRPITRRRDHE